MVVEGKCRATCNCYYLMLRNVAQLIGSSILISTLYDNNEEEKKAGRGEDDLKYLLIMLAVCLLGPASLGFIGALALWKSLKLCETNVERASSCATCWFYFQIGSCCLAWVFPPVGVLLSFQFFLIRTFCGGASDYRQGLKTENEQRQLRQTFATNVAIAGGSVIGGGNVGLKRVPINGYLPLYPGTGFQ